MGRMGIHEYVGRKRKNETNVREARETGKRAREKERARMERTYRVFRTYVCVCVRVRRDRESERERERERERCATGIKGQRVTGIQGIGEGKIKRGQKVKSRVEKIH